MSTPRVAVVVVNYRTAELALDCLRSLARTCAEEEPLLAVVVDNASGDGSAERLAEALAQEPLARFAELVRAPDNGGFARGNNLGLARVRERLGGLPDYVWLLNPDTRVLPGALRALLEFLDARPEVGLAGSRLEHEDGAQQHSRYRFPSVLGELEGTLRLGLVSRLLAHRRVAPPLSLERLRVGWVAGASLIVRGALAERLGPLDERYFLYYEETDWCLRAARLGAQCWYVPESRVVHLVGRSTGVTDPTRLRERPRPRYWFDSRRLYFETNHGRLVARLADLAFVVGLCAWRVRRRLQAKPEQDPPHLLRDFVRHALGLAPAAPAPEPHAPAPSRGGGRA